MTLYTPSKELLSEVLELDIRESKYKDIDNMLLRYGYWQECISNGKDISGVEYAKINIYELAHKCKEWAWLKYKKNIVSTYLGSAYIFPLNGEQHETTEPEAIFKACEWILEQNKIRIDTHNPPAGG